MKMLYVFLMAMIIAIGCGGCSKEKSDDNLTIIIEKQHNSAVSVSIYSLLDLERKIMSRETTFTPRSFSLYLNVGDYQLRTNLAVPVNFQIQPDRMTTIRLGESGGNTEVTYE